MKVAVVDRHFETVFFSTELGEYIKEIKDSYNCQLNVIFDENMYVIKNSDFEKDIKNILENEYQNVLNKTNALKLQYQLQELLTKYRYQKLLFIESDIMFSFIREKENLLILPKDKNFDELIKRSFSN